MTEEEIYERARYVASEEDSLRHGSLGFAKQDSDYELIVESYFEGAMWAHEQAVKEEREKAVNALVRLSHYCPNCADRGSAKCGNICMLRTFKRLLNE